MKLYILVLTLLFSQSALAVVNTRNGAYTETWVDYIDPRPGMEFKIERYYSSRSLFDGLFGFGWCSNFETKLRITTDGIVNLVECGGGLEVTYYPKVFDLKNPDHTIESIVKDYRKQKRLSSNDVKNLRTQLRSNIKMRFDYANKLGLVDIKKIKTKKNTYFAKSKGFEKISFDGQFYTRRKHNGATERFDRTGRLVQISNSGGYWIKLNYKGRKISYLVDKAGRRLTFLYDRNKNLRRIHNGSNLGATYKFAQGNLVEVTNMWSKTYIFDYDKQHNLTRVAFPDKTAIVMKYDVNRDWITEYRNRIGCIEKFNFTVDKDQPKNVYWADFSRQCNKDPKTAGRHKFWYQNYSFSADKYLHRVKETYPSSFKDAFFHPFLGRPTQITEDTTYFGFAYFLNGLINKRETKQYTESREVLAWDKVSFKYKLPEMRVTSTSKSILNKLGKTTKTIQTSYNYDSRGRLKKAYNRGGEFVAISYDQNGKIKTLKNHHKKHIVLGYRSGISKPSSIEQKGIGSIKISYDDNKTVSSVEPSSQRVVASSIVENFLNMVDFLGPLGETLKL